MRAQNEEYADYLHKEWLDGLTDSEMRTRHFLLDQKGILGQLHWFDCDFEDEKGRLDPETGYFHWRGDNGDYSTVVARKVVGGFMDHWVLVGTDGVLGEIILEKEDTNTETVVE